MSRTLHRRALSRSPRHNRLTLLQMRRPATGATVRADGRCNYASSVISPARTTLSSKPGWMQVFRAVRCIRKAGVTSLGTGPMRGSPRPARAWRAGTVPRGIAPSVCSPTVWRRASRARSRRSRRWSVRPSRPRVWKRCASSTVWTSSYPGRCAGCDGACRTCTARCIGSRASWASLSRWSSRPHGVCRPPGGGAGFGGAARDRRGVVGRAAQAARIRAPAPPGGGALPASNTVRGLTRRDARRRVSRAGKPPASAAECVHE